jgi:hypothetical protein
MSYGATSSPFGLLPTKGQGSSTDNFQFAEYLIPSAYATSLFQGDPLYQAATGTIIIAVAGDTNPILGVLKGVKYFDSNNNFVSSPYWPANTVIGSLGTLSDGNKYATALVYNDPNQLYVVQTNATPGLAILDQLSNVDMVAGAGSTVSGLSGWMLNQATLGAGATKQLKIIALTPDVRNGSGVGYNTAVVRINNQVYAGGTGTVGI